jgi:hypothetical protein
MTAVNVLPNPVGGGRPDAVRSRFHGKKMHTPEQILAVLAAWKEPRFPSQVEVVGLNSFNGEHQALKQRLFEDLHSQGFLQLVHAGDVCAEVRNRA